MRKKAHREAILRVLQAHCQKLPTTNQDAIDPALRRVWDFFEEYGEFVRQPAMEMLAQAAAATPEGTVRSQILDLRVAFERFTRNRPLRDIADLRPVPPPPPPSDLAPGNLRPGDRLLVLRAFLDFSRRQVEAGEVLTFCSYSYFPHDGGYTIHFEERTLRFAEIDEESDKVLSHLEDYFRKLPPQ